MKKLEEKKISTIIRLKESYEKHLRFLARKKSLDESKDYSIQDLIIQAIIEKYFKGKF